MTIDVNHIAILASRSYPADEFLSGRAVSWALLDDNRIYRREVYMHHRNSRPVDSGWVHRGRLRHERWKWITFWMESGFTIEKGPAYEAMPGENVA